MLEARVLDFFESVCRVRAKDALLVAVSGGPDSVALLTTLLAVRDALGVRLEVAHLDHSLRGQEGADDAAFVTRLAEEHGLALHRRRVNIPELQEAEGGSVEAIARRERYGFLEEARAVAGARWIVTGHNANDQVETFLMNLLRGAGPRGLGGMLAVGPGPLCRPLLTTWRAEILDYLESEDQTYCLDSTNQDLSRTRNRVRHRLLPYLEEEFGPSVLEILSRGSRLMNELDEFMNLEAGRILEDVRRRTAEDEQETLSLDIGRFQERHPALQRSMLRSALQDLAGGLQDWNLVHIDLLMDLMLKEEGTGSLDLPGGLVARREYERLVLGPSGGEDTPAPEPSSPLDLQSSGEVRWGRSRLCWTVADPRERDPGRWGSEPHRTAFDLSRAIAPIYLRGLRLGDRLEPLGMTGSQKLSDLLINRKVPRALRTWVPVLCDNGGPEAGERILWVVGQRRSRHAQVESGTAQVVYFEAETIV